MPILYVKVFEVDGINQRSIANSEFPVKDSDTFREVLRQMQERA